jgi:hypothetical protein
MNGHFSGVTKNRTILNVYKLKEVGGNGYEMPTELKCESVIKSSNKQLFLYYLFEALLDPPLVNI